MPGVAGEWFADIAVGGKMLPLTSHTINQITIRSNIHQELPTFSIVLNDNNGMYQREFLVGDSTRVNMSLGDGFVRNPTFQGITQGNPSVKRTPGGGCLFILQGVMDNIEWLRKIANKPIEGTSADVISQLASQIGLKAETDSTSDKQVWLPFWKPFAQYARWVAAHGYASSQSCMLLGVTETGKIRYKDLNKIINGSSKLRFSVLPQDGDYVALQTEVDSKGGAYNNSRGYGSTTVYDKMDGGIEELTKVEMGVLAGILGAGRAALDAIGESGGRIEALPMFLENAHKNFNKAIHQNSRIKAQYGEDLRVMTDRVTGLSILDLVTFVPASLPVSGAHMVGHGGDYVTIGKVIAIQNGRYWEIENISSQGISE